MVADNGVIALSLRGPAIVAVTSSTSQLQVVPPASPVAQDGTDVAHDPYPVSDKQKDDMAKLEAEFAQYRRDNRGCGCFGFLRRTKQRLSSPKTRFEKFRDEDDNERLKKIGRM